MKKRAKIKRMIYDALPALVLSLALTFIVFYSVSKAISFENEKVFDVRDNTIRLRIVANSDADYDRKLKYEVRDGIIKIAPVIFSGAESIEKAREIAYNNIENIRENAKQTVEKNGYSYPVSVYLQKENCPVRRYSDFTFPAGEYLTLRVDIGKAEGRNWWCVMFPPLCLDFAADSVCDGEETFLAYGFPEETVKELCENTEKTERFKTRIAALDFIYGIFDKNKTG